MLVLSPSNLQEFEHIGIYRFADQPDSSISGRNYPGLVVARSEFWSSAREFSAARQKLSSMASHRELCDDIGVDPPDATSIALARQALAYFERVGLSPASIIPSTDGGIAMSFVSGANRAFIEFSNSEEIVAACYSAEGETTVWQLENLGHALSSAVEQIRVHLAS